MVWNLAYTDAKYAARKEGREEGLAEGRAVGLTEGRAEGRAQGLAEGRSEGLTEGIELSALNALKLGIAPETVVQITNLSLEKVLELQQQIKS